MVTHVTACRAVAIRQRGIGETPARYISRFVGRIESGVRDGRRRRRVRFGRARASCGKQNAEQTRRTRSDRRHPLLFYNRSDDNRIIIVKRDLFRRRIANTRTRPLCQRPPLWYTCVRAYCMGTQTVRCTTKVFAACVYGHSPSYMIY